MRTWLACLAALWLAACAELPAADGPLGLGPPLSYLNADGRISLRQGEQLSHMRFRWEHTPQGDVLLLMSPLGQGVAELVRDADGARLVQPNQATITAATLPQLAQRVFGASLPLEAVVDWLRGAQPALSGEVDGWQVLISATSAFRQHRLLRVMEVRREDVELKLIVDEWGVPE